MNTLNRDFWLFAFSTLFALVFSSCESTDRPRDNTSTETEEATDSSGFMPSYAMINTHVENRSVWLQDVNTGIEQIGGIQAVEKFYNMFDSTHVYVLFSLEEHDKLELLQEHLKTEHPDQTIGAVMMNERTDVNLEGGSGELYSFVTHYVKDFDIWFDTFMVMEGVKNADSIYILGVFSEVGDSLNVGVLSRAVNMGKAAAYARTLESSNMLKASGVDSEPDAIVLRKWDYAK